MIVILSVWMRIGESGLGKSTLIQSLFLTNFFGNKPNPPSIGEYIQFVRCNPL